MNRGILPILCVAYNLLAATMTLPGVFGNFSARPKHKDAILPKVPPLAEIPADLERCAPWSFAVSALSALAVQQHLLLFDSIDRPTALLPGCTWWSTSYLLHPSPTFPPTCLPRTQLNGASISLNCVLFAIDRNAQLDRLQLAARGVVTSSQPVCKQCDRQVTLSKLSLAECSEKCSAKEGVECQSFHYDSESQMCSLNKESGPPFGPTELIAAKEEETTAFYQQICIASNEICQAPYSFERVPQSVLVGYALEVQQAAGLSECLMLCLESFRRFHIECKSVMYYYETLECIMNREDRINRPDLFSNDTQGLIVDYFENNCAGAHCFSPLTTQLVKTADHALEDQREVAIAKTDLRTCSDTCVANEVDGRSFPCKAFMYDHELKQCYLAGEASLPRGRSELTKFDNVDYYEIVCLTSLRLCASGDAAFVRTPNSMLVGHAGEVQEVQSLAECLDVCLDSKTLNCKSVMYFYQKAECILNEETRTSSSEMFTMDTKGEAVDYFEKVCNDTGVTSLPDSDGGNETPAADDVSSTATELPVNNRPNVPKSFGENDVTEDDSVNEKVKGTLETECRFDGVFIHVTFSSPTSGAIFVKNKFATCRVDFSETQTTTLALPFPGAAASALDIRNKDCGGDQLSPSVWSYMVVVQKNGLGVPGLMTAKDRLFNITCDYSESGPVLADGFATVTGSAPESRLYGVHRTEIVSPNVRMLILRDNEPVSTVLLGEELQLKWEFLDDNIDLMGFFVRECVAERLGGNPPDPSPVKLITDGCPDNSIRDRLMSHPIEEIEDGFMTKLQMFRFDGSRSVKMRCVIDMCVERCNPVTCRLNGTSVKSMGRKKRQYSDYGNLVTSTKSTKQSKHKGAQSKDKAKSTKPGSKIDTETISGTFTIVDHLDDVLYQGSYHSPPPSEQHVDKTGRVCMLRPLFVGLFVLLGILSLVEGCVVFIYFYAKYHNKYSAARRRCPSGGESSGSSTYASGFYGSLHRLIDDKIAGIANRFRRHSLSRTREDPAHLAKRRGRLRPHSTTTAYDSYTSSASEQPSRRRMRSAATPKRSGVAVFTTTSDESSTCSSRRPMTRDRDRDDMIIRADMHSPPLPPPPSPPPTSSRREQQIKKPPPRPPKRSVVPNKSGDRSLPSTDDSASSGRSEAATYGSLPLGADCLSLKPGGSVSFEGANDSDWSDEVLPTAQQRSSGTRSMIKQQYSTQESLTAMKGYTGGKHYRDSNHMHTMADEVHQRIRRH
uniref:Uncharacterized protein n=1 Tax=Plectus sambesii TaxID=2011161 RepID=A0A914WCM3_9BILA